jgi:putative ATPase
VAAISDPPRLPPALLLFLADVADGDARQALNGLELALKVCEGTLQTTLDDDDKGKRARRDELLMEAVRKGLRKGYHRSGEERYDMISAMHKSLRGSDGSAAMYWLARMLTGGEDPLYIARRLIVVASEDVGLADNHALPLATATYTACQTIGMPECRINLAVSLRSILVLTLSTASRTSPKRPSRRARTRRMPALRRSPPSAHSPKSPYRCGTRRQV